MKHKKITDSSILFECEQFAAINNSLATYKNDISPVYH